MSLCTFSVISGVDRYLENGKAYGQKDRPGQTGKKAGRKDVREQRNPKITENSDSPCDSYNRRGLDVTVQTVPLQYVDRS